MDTQRYTGRLEDGQVPAVTRASGPAGGRLALITLFVGGAAGAALGWSANQATRPVGIADAPVTAVAPQVIEAPTASQAGLGTPGRKSLVVAIPEDRAYVTSSSIAVAGMAFGRPHSPRIRSVHVELYVGGALVQGVDLEVFSSRFAGIVELPTPIARGDAELRISDPTRQGGPVVVRRLRIDAPASPLDPTG